MNDQMEWNVDQVEQNLGDRHWQMEKDVVSVVSCGEGNRVGNYGDGREKGNSGEDSDEGTEGNGDREVGVACVGVGSRVEGVEDGRREVV